MVNHKKSKRKGGRKLSSGSISYSKLSPTSQLMYHRLGAAKSRGHPHDDPTEAAVGANQPAHSGEGSATSSATVSRRDRSSPCQQTRCGAGKPRLDPDAGPMSPGALATRPRRLGHEQYKRKKISLIRRKANLMRLDRQGCRDNVSRETMGELVEEIDEQELEEEEDDENKKRL